MLFDSHSELDKLNHQCCFFFAKLELDLFLFMFRERQGPAVGEFVRDESQRQGRRVRLLSQVHPRLLRHQPRQ